MADILGFPHGDRPGDVYQPAPNENPNVIDPPPEEQSEDQQLLQDAYNLISGERQEQHGTPERCHERIAQLWTWWTGFQIDPHDVAMMMALLKIARIKTGMYNRDCYTDLLGYGALAGRMRKAHAQPR